MLGLNGLISFWDDPQDFGIIPKMGRSELPMFTPGLRDRVRQCLGLASILNASTKAESIGGVI